MRRLNPNWCAEMEKEIESKEFQHHITSNLSVKRFIIGKLIENNIGYKITNKGAGICQIIAEDNLCPHCKGKGVST